MSTPNEPNKPTETPQGGPSPKGQAGPSGSGDKGARSTTGTRPAVSVQDQAPRPADAPRTGTAAPNKSSGDVAEGKPAAQPANPPRPAGNGQGPGGVPPWQRAGGQANPGQPPQGPAKPGQPPQGPPSGPGKPPPPSGSQPPPGSGGQQQPGSPGPGRRPSGPPPRRQQPPAGAQTTKRPVITGTAAPKPIDGPTRNIDRRDLPQEELPDLDAIHHPESAPGAVRAVEAVPTPGGAMGALRASVQLRRIDPWSAFKVSAVLSVASFFIWMIAVGVLYLILDGMGVWDQLNNSFGTLVSSDTTTESSFEISAGGVFGIAALIGAVNVVLFTALATVGSFIYNLSSDLVGGMEVTLADRD